MKVVLARQLAHWMSGVDMSDHQMADVMDLSSWDADLLIAERWALPDSQTENIGVRTAGRWPPAPPLSFHWNGT
jgi:hypothetical protein